MRFRPAFFFLFNRARVQTGASFFLSYACRILNLSFFFFFHSEKRKTWLEESVHRCPSYASVHRRPSLHKTGSSRAQKGMGGGQKGYRVLHGHSNGWFEKTYQGSSEREVNRSRAVETRNFFDLMDNFFISSFFSILGGN